MLFVIDLDTLEIIEGANDKRRVNQREASRGDDAPFEVHFVRAGAQQQLPSGAVLTFAAKADLKFDGPAVVLQSGFALTGSGSTAEYAADVDLATVPLDALLEVDGDDTNDLPFVDLMGEFSWQLAGAKPTTARRFRFRVNNDVYRGGEGTPSALPDPADWMPAPLVLGVPPVVQTAAQWNANLMGYPEDGDTFVIDDQNGTVENYYFGSDPLGGPAPYIDISGDLYDIVSELIVLLENSTLVSGSQTGHADGHFTLNSLLQGEIGNDIIFTYVPNPVIFPQNEGFDIGFDLYGQDPTTADALGQLAIVAETDVYAATRVSPAKWVQINN